MHGDYRHPNFQTKRPLNRILWVDQHITFVQGILSIWKLGGCQFTTTTTTTTTTSSFICMTVKLYSIAKA